MTIIDKESERIVPPKEAFEHGVVVAVQQSILTLFVCNSYYPGNEPEWKGDEFPATLKEAHDFNPDLAEKVIVDHLRNMKTIFSDNNLDAIGVKKSDIPNFVWVASNIVDSQLRLPMPQTVLQELYQEARRAKNLRNSCGGGGLIR